MHAPSGTGSGIGEGEETWRGTGVLLAGRGYAQTRPRFPTASATSLAALSCLALWQGLGLLPSTRVRCRQTVSVLWKPPFLILGLPELTSQEHGALALGLLITEPFILTDSNMWTLLVNG